MIQWFVKISLDLFRIVIAVSNIFFHCYLILLARFILLHLSSGRRECDRWVV
jgi:hypothetical protein